MRDQQTDRPVLVVDDEEDIVRGLSKLLRSHGIGDVVTCTDARRVEGLVEQHRPDVVLLDLTMPCVSGQELLENLQARWPEIAVIIVTASEEVKTAVECMKAGAADYMVKAVEESRLVSGVHRAMEIRRLKRQYGLLRSSLLSNTLHRPEIFDAILTADRRMQSVFLFIESIAETREPVLITGETGVGKNLIAGAVHAASGRSGSYVSVNIAGLDDTMFSDSLFGHRKGAFTGAAESRGGLVQQAEDGTIFLDEIGDLSLSSQTKLLRILDTGEYYPLGSDLARRTNARMIFATNRDVEVLSRDDTFRRDLFYRLSTYALRVPPLRERPKDIPLLVDHFVEQAAGELGKPVPAVPPELYLLLENYDFPGNIRELRSVVFEMMSRHNTGTLGLAYVKQKLGLDRRPAPETEAIFTGPRETPSLSFGDRLPTIKEATESLVDEALRRTKGNQSMAAGMLGISHQALSKRLRNRVESGGQPTRPSPM